MTDEQNERAARVWRDACAAFEDAADPELPKFENVNAGDQAATAVIAADRAGLVAEIERLREVAIALHGALAAHTCYGCPACHGDCSSANPPMMFCPTAQAQAAYFMFDRAALKDTRND